MILSFCNKGLNNNVYDYGEEFTDAKNESYDASESFTDCDTEIQENNPSNIDNWICDGDDDWNVLDIVTLANYVLANTYE